MSSNAMNSHSLDDETSVQETWAGHFGNIILYWPKPSFLENVVLWKNDFV